MKIHKVYSQPLIACFAAFAISGCVTTDQKTTIAPVAPALHSEFEEIDNGRSFYGPFLAATQAQQDSNHGMSAHFYMQALDADPSSRFVADRAFFQLLVSGRMEDAASLALKISQEPTTEEDDLVRLMYVLEAFKREDWQAVRDRMDKPISRGFGYIISPLLKAWSYGAEGNYAGASDILAELSKSKQLKPLAQEHSAYILDYLDRDMEAAVEYAALTHSDAPTSLQPAIAYAYLLYQNGDEDGARDFLGKQAVRFKNHAFLLREGNRITAGGKPTQAVATPRGAASMVFYRLATEFSQSNSPEAALVYYRIATYITPEVTDIYFMLGSLLERLGNVDGAAAALNAVPPSSPLRKLATARRIDVLRGGGRNDQAEELLRRGIARNPTDFDMLVGLADLLQQADKFAESIPYYDRAIASVGKPSRRDWVVYFSRGVSYERLGEWAKAERDLQSALTLSPDEPSVLNYLGYSWIDRGQKIAEAKAMIEQAVEARPEDGFIVDSLGWVYYLTGDYAEAVRTLEKAVRLEPDDTTINDHLGDAYWQVGRKIEARFQWQHALDGGVADDERQKILDKLEHGLSLTEPANRPS
ncbi:MAG: tetratricopeptide repeat protein [Kordiimonas sp.]